MPLGSRKNGNATKVEWDMTITFGDGKIANYAIDEDEKDNLMMTFNNCSNSNSTGFVTFDTFDGGAAAVDLECIRDVYFIKA